MNERFTFGYGTTRPEGAAPPRAADPVAPVVESGPAPAPRSRRREPRDWAFTGLMAFTALLFFRPQDTLTFLNAFHLAELAALTGLGAMVLRRLQRGQSITRVTPELVGVAALGGLILALAPFSIWPGGSVGLFTDVYVKVILIYVLMTNTLTTPKRIEQFTWLIIIATGYIGLRAGLDYARGINLIENGRVQGAVGGIFRNPNDLALNMVVVLPLGISMALRWKGVAMRLLAAVCTVLMIVAIIASHSRSGTVGLVMMMLFLAAYLVRRRPGIVLAGAVLLMLALPLAPESYWHRIQSITDGSQDATGSREARRVLLREGYAAFLANPITGVGAGQFKNYAPQQRTEAWRETHNVVLQVASELGAGGVLVFLFLVLRGGLTGREVRVLLRRATGRGSRRNGRATPEEAVIGPDEAMRLEAHSAAMSASLAGWFFCALFASVAYNWTFYYLLALAAAPREVLLDRLPPLGRRRHATAAVPRVQEAQA